MDYFGWILEDIFDDNFELPDLDEGEQAAEKEKGGWFGRLRGRKGD